MNVATIIDAHPDDAVALTADGRSTTYAELRDEVARLRGGLARYGVEKGDRIAVVSENDWAFVVTYLAATGLGAVVVPINPSSPGPELQLQLGAVEPVAIVFGPGASGGRDFDPAAVGPSLRHVLAADDVDVRGGEPLADLFDADPVAAADCDEGDPAVMMFTAGTSGAPRVAVLTHGNLRSNLDQLQAHPGRGVQPADVGLGVLPMFHIFGLNVVLGLTLFGGGSVVVVREFHPAEAVRIVRDHGVTILAGAPTMYAALAAVPDATAEDFRSVRLAVSGASRLAPETAAAFEARFGIAIYEGYGLTETSPVVTSSVLSGPPKPGSIGVPLSGEEVRLVDEDGDDVLAGDSGELWVRGPNVFSGYWRDPAATAEVLTGDGWLRTGDVGVVGDDGEIYLVDRAKDLIIVNGFNVYPGEVEEVLLEYRGVAHAAVVGVDDARTGEAVHAYVVPTEDGDVDPEALMRFARERLARYKTPTEITPVPSLPYGLAGKLLRRELRRLAR